MKRCLTDHQVRRHIQTYEEATKRPIPWHKVIFYTAFAVVLCGYVWVVFG